jgi:hypothetical protein
LARPRQFSVLVNNKLSYHDCVIHRGILRPKRLVMFIRGANDSGGDSFP